MRSDLIVLPFQGIGCDLSLFDGVEPFRVEHLSKFPVKEFIVSVLPWQTLIDLQRLDSYPFQPVLQVCCNELRPVVSADKLWLAMFHQQQVQSVQNIVRIHLGPYRYAHASRVYSSRTVSIL